MAVDENQAISGLTMALKESPNLWDSSSSVPRISVLHFQTLQSGQKRWKYLIQPHFHISNRCNEMKSLTLQTRPDCSLTDKLPAYIYESSIIIKAKSDFTLTHVQGKKTCLYASLPSLCLFSTHGRDDCIWVWLHCTDLLIIISAWVTASAAITHLMKCFSMRTQSA